MHENAFAHNIQICVYTSIHFDSSSSASLALRAWHYVPVLTPCHCMAVLGTRYYVPVLCTTHCMAVLRTYLVLRTCYSVAALRAYHYVVVLTPSATRHYVVVLPPWYYVPVLGPCDFVPVLRTCYSVAVLRTWDFVSALRAWGSHCATHQLSEPGTSCMDSQRLCFISYLLKVQRSDSCDEVTGAKRCYRVAGS